MLTLLVTILILCLVVYAAHLLIRMLNVPETVKTILYLIVAVVAIVVLLRQFGVGF